MTLSSLPLYLFVSLACFCLCMLCAGHPGPHLYPLSAHDSEAASNETCTSEPPPSIWSFHVHVLFQGSNHNQTAQSMQLRQTFIDTFSPNGTCTTLYHGDEGLCMFEPNFKPWGPFVTAEWAVFVPKDRYMEVVPWIMQRRTTVGTINAACVSGDSTCIGLPRPSFSILVHPNSGCEYQDHGVWPLWGGQQWLINMDAMDTETPFDIVPPSDKPFPLKDHDSDKEVYEDYDGLRD